MMGKIYVKGFRLTSLVVEMVQTLGLMTKYRRKEMCVLAPNFKCNWNLLYAVTSCSLMWIIVEPCIISV